MNRGKLLVTSAALVLGAAFLVQALASMRSMSLTSDELTHVPSGYTYLKSGEVRLNPQHPPLVKLLAALPLTTLDPVIDLSDPSYTNDPPNEWVFGYKFFEANDADAVLFRGRLPTVLLALLTGWIVFRWSRELWGDAGGLASLFLWAFSPNLIAHGRLVTMDVPLACFFTLTLYTAWRWVRRGGRTADLALAAVGLGAALATKYSAVLLPLLVVALWAVALWSGDDAPRLRKLVGAVTVLAFSSALIVWAAYLFPDDPLLWLDGLRRVNVDHDPDYPYYLLGQFRTGGFWYYFPAAFLFKTPLPTLLALVASLVLFLRCRARHWIDDAFLAVPAVAFFLFTAAFADNLGVRYLLPVYPLLFVWIGRLAKPGRALRFVFPLMAVLYAGSALWIYPHYLSFFNLLAGGPVHGHRVLDDSNIDWGQDLKRLKLYMEREGIDRVRLKYGGNASPRYYGIAWDDVSDREWAGRPLPGVYAMSTHLLIRGEHYAAKHGMATDWLTRYEPVGRVGYSIYLFRFD